MIRSYAVNMIAQTLGRSFSVAAQVIIFVLIRGGSKNRQHYHAERMRGIP